MDNMFWEIPQHEAVQSVTWAFDACRKGKNDLWFSLARGGGKALDRIGKASGTQFFLVSESAVRRFVEFDTRLNNLFTIGRVLLAKGTKGVPIGGFISAQLAEIWAVWKEHEGFFATQADNVAHLWRQRILTPNPPPPPP